MPISKNGKEYYTKEQYEAARYNGNALEYARSQGYELIRQGGYYTMKEHDSMVFTPNGRWFWNSRGVHGGAMEFMMYYENKTLTAAVLTLAGERQQSVSHSPERKETQPPAAAKPELPRYTFKLPDRAQNFKQLFYYLCSQRGLDKSVVQEMIRQSRLYQSAYTRPDGKVICNATFVYQDAQGNPVGAYQRGMKDIEGQPPYKRDVPGSDKRFGWLLAAPFNPATEVRVFEAAIDAASDASLEAMPGMRDGDWRNDPIDRLSLEGLSFQPLQTYLQTHPDVRQVTFMLDADEPGRRAVKEFSDRLIAQGYQVTDREPPFGKDWNNVLTETRAVMAEQQAGPQPESPAPTPVPEM